MFYNVLLFLLILLISSSNYAQEIDTTKIQRHEITNRKSISSDKPDTVNMDLLIEHMKQKQANRIKNEKHMQEQALSELTHSNQKYRGRSMVYLGEVPIKEAIEPLLLALKKEPVPINVTYAMGSLVKICLYYQIQKPEIINEIVINLNHPNTGTALRAAMALVDLGDKNKSIKLLSKIVNGENIDAWDVSGFAMIGDIVKGNERLTVYNKEKKTMRKLAIQYLEKIGTKDSLEQLKDCLVNVNDPDLEMLIEKVLSRN